MFICLMDTLVPVSVFLRSDIVENMRKIFAASCGIPTSPSFSSLLPGGILVLRQILAESYLLN
jgi:hypothetical protein